MSQTLSQALGYNSEQQRQSFRVEHHSSKEPRKENPQQAQKDNEGRKKKTNLQVIPVMEHRNFKFLRKKLLALNVNTLLFDKIAQNYILMKVYWYSASFIDTYYNQNNTIHFLS